MADGAPGGRPPAPDDVPLRDAATVMLVRDALDGGVEITHAHYSCHVTPSLSGRAIADDGPQLPAV